MRARPPVAARPTAVRGAVLSVDVVVIAITEEQFVVLVQRAGSGAEPWELPWRSVRPADAPDDEAQRALSGLLKLTPTWMEQIRANADSRRHPSGAPMTIGYAATLPFRALPADRPFAWLEVSALKGLSQRQRVLVDQALRYLRERMDIVPIAFRLLPTMFTLGDLQSTYELLLGRRLHKASFRRALQAAYLVEPTEEWRREGRGRPAQLFRYAPRRKKGVRRTVRFDLLG